jgi:site-specific recombinase XerD
MSFLFDRGKEIAHSMLMTQTTRQPTLTEALDQFTRELDKSPLTIHAYRADVMQFIRYLAETDYTVTTVSQIERYHITDYLAALKGLGRVGATRARKLISLQVFFSFLVKSGAPRRPALTDRKKKNGLVQAAGDPRDYAILQVFLQTGIRVSELVAILVSDVDMEQKTVAIHGKGEKERTIPLEKKATQALKSWLAVRPKVQDQRLFLTYQGTGFSIRGVRKLVDKYLKLASITKKTVRAKAASKMRW